MILLYVLVLSIFNGDPGTYCAERMSSSAYCRAKYPSETKVWFYSNKSSAIADYRTYKAEASGVRLFEISVSTSVTAAEITPPLVECAEVRQDLKIN